MLAGSFAGVTGPVEGIVTEPLLLDLAVPAGARVVVPLPAGHHAFAYRLRGARSRSASRRTSVPRGSAAVLGAGDAALVAAARAAARVLLAAARPLGRAGRALWPVRHEHARRNPPGDH